MRTPSWAAQRRIRRAKPACGERSRAAARVSVSYPAVDCEGILRIRKGNARKMDRMNDLTSGAKIVLGATIAFLIVSFFSWFHYTGPGKEELDAIGADT